MIGVGTCNLACWGALEDVCRCMCGGRNHGISRYGQENPGRYCRRKEVAYKLEAIYDNWIDAENAARVARKRYNTDNWLPHWSESAFNQAATGHMLKWPEVQAAFKAQEYWKEVQLVWVRTDEFNAQKPTG